MTASFFGEENDLMKLYDALYYLGNFLIARLGVKRFYIGNENSFDIVSALVLYRLKQKHPYIQYMIMNQEGSLPQTMHCRNQRLCDKGDYIVCNISDEEDLYMLQQAEINQKKEVFNLQYYNCLE